VVLFGVMFYWTPPHFWALAIKYREDYSAADIPMLPSVVSIRETAVRMMYYTVVLIVLSVAFSPVADMGLIYLISAIVLGLIFLVLTYHVLRDQDTRSAMRLFGYSITYITLLFGAMVVDQLVRGGF
jgi:protoheme IX farnesyltransferase